jgi:ribonuclease HI
MKVSQEKTTYSIFCRGECEGDLPRLNLKLSGANVQYEKCPKYLGVILDPTLSFQDQVKATLAKCRRRLGAIRKLAGASWRPRTRHIKMLYTAVVESVLHYGVGVWGPGLGANDRGKIDKFQAEAAGVVLGVRVGQDEDAVMAEAGLLPIAKVGEVKAANLVCRAWARRDIEDPLRQAAEEGCRWVESGAAMMERAGCRKEQIIQEWEGEGAEGGSVEAREWMRKGKLNLVEEEAQVEDVEDFHSECDQVWYTDGSVRGRVGGSGWIRFAKGESEEKDSGGRVTSKAAISFTAEQEAILAVMEELMDGTMPTKCKIAILTDSLSNVASFKSAGARDEVEARILERASMLCRADNEITIRFIRGHIGHRGNELADSKAGELSAAGVDAAIPIDYRYAKMANQMQASEESRESTGKRADELEGIKLRHLKCISNLRATPLICSGSGKMEGGRAAERVFTRMRTGKDLMGLECGCSERSRGEHAKTVKHILYECPALEEYRTNFKAMAERKWREDVKEAAKRQPDRVVVNPWGKTSILQRAPGETHEDCSTI